MDVFPDMEIRIPENQEGKLLAEMRTRAHGAWCWQPHDPLGRPPEDGHFYFHRLGTDGFPPCSICLYRKRAGYLIVGNIVPDAKSKMNPVPLRRCERILKEFRDRIASPAARSLNGMARLATSQHSLENYFSKKAIHLLESFCLGANHGDLGRHFCDQRRWMRFLRYVRQYYRRPPHCDVFGKCLREKKCWPDHGIDTLVHEYDFAMRLLSQA